jgi:hypothetical protein
LECAERNFCRFSTRLRAETSAAFEAPQGVHASPGFVVSGDGNSLAFALKDAGDSVVDYGKSKLTKFFTHNFEYMRKTKLI